jgi:hypothetical protein
LADKKLLLRASRLIDEPTLTHAAATVARNAIVKEELNFDVFNELGMTKLGMAQMLEHQSAQ